MNQPINTVDRLSLIIADLESEIRTKEAEIGPNNERLQALEQTVKAADAILRTPYRYPNHQEAQAAKSSAYSQRREIVERAQADQRELDALKHRLFELRQQLHRAEYDAVTTADLAGELAPRFEAIRAVDSELADPNPIPPWDFRHGTGEASAERRMQAGEVCPCPGPTLCTGIKGGAIALLRAVARATNKRVLLVALRYRRACLIHRQLSHCRCQLVPVRAPIRNRKCGSEGDDSSWCRKRSWLLDWWRSAIHPAAHTLRLLLPRVRRTCEISTEVTA